MNLKNKINDLKKQGLDSNCYYLINSKDMSEILAKCGSDKSKLKDFYELCLGWDKKGDVIPLEIGLYIESLINDPNIKVGIHRSSIIAGTDDKNLINIMQNGLENNAQLSQGALTEVPGLTKTISIVENMLHTIPLLKSTYKGSNGSIIFSFPANYLNQDGNVLEGFEDEI